MPERLLGDSCASGWVSKWTASRSKAAESARAAWIVDFFSRLEAAFVASPYAGSGPDLGIGRGQLCEVAAHQGRRGIAAGAGRGGCGRRHRRRQGAQLGREHALRADAIDDVLGIRDAAGDGPEARRLPRRRGRRGPARSRTSGRCRARPTPCWSSSEAESVACEPPLPPAMPPPIVASCFDGRKPSGTTPSPLGVTRLVTVATPGVARSRVMRSRSRASDAGASMSPAAAGVHEPGRLDELALGPGAPRPRRSRPATSDVGRELGQDVEVGLHPGAGRPPGPGA